MARLANLIKLLEKHQVSGNELARALDRSPNGLHNAIRRGVMPLDLRMDIETVLRDAGYKLPKNLWIDEDGNDAAANPRQLRALCSGDVITAPCHSPLSRERKLSRYLSPNQLDPRKEKKPLKPLTINARSRFGLKRDPFRCELQSVDDVLLTKEHSQAVEAMLDAVRMKDFVAILGEVGTGKSTCLEVFQQRCPQSVRIIKIHTLDKASLNGNNIFDAIILDIAGELDVKTTIPAQRERKSRKVLQLLETLEKQEQTAVLVIDEAHGLAKECLRALKRLHELDRGYKKLLSIILIGQLELIPKLEDPTLREVGQRCARFEFRGLNGKTADYIRYKIEKAGGKLENIFDPAALKEVENILTRKDGRKKFGPYPLQVNSFLTLAMNEADLLDEKRITVDLLNQIRPSAA